MKRAAFALLATKLTLIAGATTLALVPLPEALVEVYYSNGVYPQLQYLLTGLSNTVRFAIGDVLLGAGVIAIAVWWVVRLARPGRKKRIRVAALLAFHTLVIASGIYLSFLLLWGFNYMRPPLAHRLDHEAARVTPEAVSQLKRTCAEMLNSEYAEAGSSGEEWLSQLHISLEGVLRQLGAGSVRPADPKQSVLDRYLGAAGVTGFINPFGHEVILDSELLAAEKPFAVAHEWSHLAGYADESEASFVGLMACLQSGQHAVRYSGWLALYEHLADSETALQLRPEVAADLRAIAQRQERRRIRLVSKAQTEVYDQFLRAHRVKEGVGSYGLLVNLVVGTRMAEGWVPVLRQ